MSEAATFNQEDYSIIFDWHVRIEYTQMPRPGRGAKKPRPRSTGFDIIGMTRSLAVAHITDYVKKKRYWRLDKIVSLVPVRVACAWHIKTADSLPREQWHLIKLPE